MKLNRYLGAVLALFLFMFFYEWLVHGYLLSPYYQKTEAVWRTLEEMQHNFTSYTLILLFLAAWLSYAFTQFYPQGGVKNGLFFGLVFGIFAGVLTASWYFHLPVPKELGWAWFFSGLGEGLGGGAVLGFLYKA